MQATTEQLTEYYTDITVGADPEFFLMKGKTPVSAHDVVPGNKAEPYKLKRGICVQADGTAVEFNIPPAKTKEEFTDSLQDGLEQIRQIVPKDLTFSFNPSVAFDKKYLDSLPKTATELGCSPDYQACNRVRKSPMISQAMIGTIRVAGGHIHVGWGKNIQIEPGHMFDCAALAKQLDHFFKSYERFWDEDRIRPRFYGMLGAFRPKSYGVEYRGLSSAWLKYPKMWPWIYENTKAMFDVTKRGVLLTPHNWGMLSDTNDIMRYYFKGVKPFAMNMTRE